MKTSKMFMILLAFVLLSSLVLAISPYRPKRNVDLENKYGVVNATNINVVNLTISNPAAECAIDNTFGTRFFGINTTCRGINWTNVPYLTVAGLTKLIGDTIFDNGTMIYNATTNTLNGSFILNTTGPIYAPNLTLSPSTGTNLSILYMKGEPAGNACAGNATLLSGVVAVNTTCATLPYHVLITPITTAGTPGFTYVKKLSGSFNITGIVTDTSVYDWSIIRIN